MLTRKRLAAFLIALSSSGLFSAEFLPRFLAGERTVVPTVWVIDSAQSKPTTIPPNETEALRLLSLNIAHGRKNGRHQLLQANDQITANLDAIATVLQREQPHLVALQEADIASSWNGGYNHVAYLAEQANFEYALGGEAVQAAGLAYGTALLSSQELTDPLAVTFEAASMSPKGFVISTIAWPTQPAFMVDVVSVHLDFARESVRVRQLEELHAILEQRNNPTIVLGDLNTELGERSTIPPLLEQWGLQRFEPNSRDLVTFQPLKKRLDWILISEEFEFVRYEVVPDVLSDHLGIVAEVGLRR